MFIPDWYREILRLGISRMNKGKLEMEDLKATSEDPEMALKTENKICWPSLGGDAIIEAPGAEEAFSQMPINLASPGEI